MDPLGFALENFDAVGRWRERDEAYNPVDASGVLPGGVAFGGLPDFRAELVGAREQVVTTLTEKLLTYALGRGLEPADAPEVRRIVRRAASVDYRMSALITGIVQSLPFRMRRTARAEAAGAEAHAGPDAGRPRAAGVEGRP
jgi:hypothetical protein